MKREQLLNEVYERIVKLMKAGTVPWSKSWVSRMAPPANLLTGRAYRGVNWLTLSSLPFDNPYWLTCGQANQLGGHVKKGEKGVHVIFFRMLEPKEEGGRRFPYMTSATVFNLSQTEGVRVPANRSVPEPPIFSNALVDGVLVSYRNSPLIRWGSKACYFPAEDAINMPSLTEFDRPENYANTLFHELVHSTGHKDRLDRIHSHRYANEELVAELGAAMLDAHVGISAVTEAQSAAYLTHWQAEITKGGPEALYEAAKMAQAAVGMILGEQKITNEEIV